MLKISLRNQESTISSADLISKQRILLTGATGYIGGKLLPLLHGRNFAIRCLVRHPEKLGNPVGRDLEVIAGDIANGQLMMKAMKNIDTAFYLVHNMSAGDQFEEVERRSAESFARAAEANEIKKIIYLGGLGDEDKALSPHLQSRHTVGKILRSSKIPVIEFRASIILGAGSISFEMIRSLVDKLPVMITPRWVRVTAQPIAISDVLSYLIAAIDLPMRESKIFEIGGADIVSYGELMKEYADLRGLRRLFLPVPLLTPYLSSLWLSLFTPLYYTIGRNLIESIRYPTVVKNNAAIEIFSSISPLGVRQAIKDALSN